MHKECLGVILLLALAACRPGPDRHTEKQKLLEPVVPAQNQPQLPTPPKPTPTTYPPGAQTVITLNVTDQVHVKSVLTELARQASVGVNMPVDIPDKRVVLTLRGQPIYEAINQLCTLSGLRASWRGNTLYVEVDQPYSHNYAVQFLNLTRTSDHHVATSTDVFANSKSQHAGDNGSDSDVKNTGETNFWQELENNLSLILDKQGSYTLHKQAGLVTIIAKHTQHQQVDAYLEKLRQAVRSQVVIEAKIIEVILKDEYRSGINWKKIKGTDIKLNMPFGDQAAAFAGVDPAAATTDTPNMLQVGVAGKAFESILQSLDTFGITRTLSSPRITVMNNQTALLKVAKNQVYFRLRYDKRYRLQAQQEDVAVSSDIQTVPIGLVLSVHPSIDLDANEVILFLRPTISRLNDSVHDPAVDIAAQNNSNVKPSKVPVVEVREIDSVLRCKSGDITVMGGLMEVRTADELSQAPILGDIMPEPMNQLFGSRGQATYVVELVILLRATISSAHPSAADTRLAAQMKDPRPLE